MIPRSPVWFRHRDHEANLNGFGALASPRLAATKKRPEQVPGVCKNKWGGSYFLSSFFSSFLGLHFSQVLPSFLASTQHLWVHSLPASLAFSQQVLSAAKAGPTNNAAAKAATVINLMNFISILYLVVYHPATESTPTATGRRLNSVVQENFTRLRRPAKHNFPRNYLARFALLSLRWRRCHRPTISCSKPRSSTWKTCKLGELVTLPLRRKRCVRWQRPRGARNQQLSAVSLGLLQPHAPLRHLR